jgi:protein SCO1/2
MRLMRNYPSLVTGRARSVLERGWSSAAFRSGCHFGPLCHLDSWQTRKQKRQNTGRSPGRFVRFGRGWLSCLLAVGSLATGFCGVAPEQGPPPAGSSTAVAPGSFLVRGVVKEIRGDARTLVIAHEAIPGYMDAMTMPFKTKDPKELQDVTIGESISFQLHVTETESWIEHVVCTERRTGGAEQRAQSSAQGEGSGGSAGEPDRPRLRSGHPLLGYHFTNELGQAVCLDDFRGQALALTFFFTRCPIPEFCPRLSKNFAQASEKLAALGNAPTNWHFLSVSFDPEFDTPSRLKAYGQGYHYDPKHWSFLTGPADRIRELAAQADMQFQSDSGSFNHNFRTLIIDATGRLQMIFPISGDLSDDIVAEMRKAAAPTNGAS